MRWAPYQLAWLADRSPQKVALKSRRIGFSEVIAFEDAQRAAGIDLVTGKLHKGISQNLISASHAQAKDLLRRSLHHVQALGKATPKGDMVETKSATIVQLRNGAFLRALSTNPRTIRSYEGDVTLDEVGSMPNADKVWAAAQPMAAPTLGNPGGYQVRAAGTPLGDDNLFYEICRGARAQSWSLHEVSIHRAVAQGFPLRGTIEELRNEVGDGDLFAQEYELSFLSASTRYISADTYDKACHDHDDLPVGFNDPGRTVDYGGIDVARRRDRTAFTRLARHGDVNWHMATEVQKAMPWDDQEAWADGLLVGVSRAAVDSTGLGSQFAERMANRWPGVIEAIDFTLQSKEMLATGLKLALERVRLRPRSDDVELRREVLSMRREITTAGNVRYLTPLQGGGHGDRAWSLALAEYASGGAAKPVGLIPAIHTPSSSTGESRGRVVERSRKGAWLR